LARVAVSLILGMKARKIAEGEERMKEKEELGRKSEEVIGDR